MSQNPVCIDPMLLAQQRTWVLSLARSLVHDPSGADDVAQETLLAGLAAPPQDAEDPRRLRAWLGRVVFNLAHLSTRRSVRRRDREEDVARPERQTSAADIAIRRSVLRLVDVAVDELQEPYRSVVIMRYFEGLSTAAIARSSNASESAVRKRLWRARGQLRIDLEQQHNGERQAWFQGALPLFALSAAGRSKSWLSLSGGAAAAKLLAAAASVALLFAVWEGQGTGSGREVAPVDSSSSRVAHRGGARSTAFLGYLQQDPGVDTKQK